MATKPSENAAGAVAVAVPSEAFSVMIAAGKGEEPG
jgi:hypothetical protein